MPWRVDTFSRWSRVGVPAGLLAVPVLWVLADSGGAITVAVSSAGRLLNGAVFSTVFGDGTLARLLDTPLLYCLEFGVVGVLGVTAIRRRARCGELSVSQREAVAILLGIVLLVTIVRPPIGGPNNLFARPMLVVWSLLACFAADAWWVSWRWRMPTGLAVFVCATGTVFAVAGSTAEGALFLTSHVESVEAARWINANTSHDAVVAFSPPDRRFGYWLRRRVVAADRRHALLFGATGEQYDDVGHQLLHAYASLNARQAAERFGRLRADVIIVDTPVPRWARPPCFEPGYQGARVAVFTRSDAGC